MIGYTIGGFVMMQLGSFQFSINTAAYQQLQRRSEYQWASQDRFGRLEGLQFCGQASDTITLSGVIYTEYRGGLGQLDAMRALAGRGRPQLLVDGYGNLLGRWVIESVEEGQTVFAAFGRPRKQEFTLQLRRREA